MGEGRAKLREPEQRLLEGISVELVNGPEEQAAWDRLVEQKHCLGNARLVGETLRYVVRAADGQWVALIGWSSPAYHLRPRDQWIGWSEKQRQRRLKFIAQNSRLLMLVEHGEYPNLASRALRLCLSRLSEDWQAYHGHPVLIAETFVDPQRFRGSSYKAGGWKLLGRTGGYSRCYRDFYTDLEHPKELWVKELSNKGRYWLSRDELPESLAAYEGQSRRSSPYSAKKLGSLWEYFHNWLTDRRAKKGQRHLQATVLSIAAVGTLAGEKGPKGFAEFAKYFTPAQRRRLRCRRKNGKLDVPSEATFRRVFKQIDMDEMMTVMAQWQEQLEGPAQGCIAVDGKTIRGSRRKDGRQEHVLSAVTHSSGRLLNQKQIAEKSNEITAFEPLLAPLPLKGTIITADAEHAQRRSAQFLVHNKQADYFFILKENQPMACHKAQQLLNTTSGPAAESWDKGHGRIEHRELWCTATTPSEVGFCGAAQLIRIRRTRWEGGSAEPQVQDVFAVTSLGPEQAHAQRLLDISRSHWSIENSNHHRRDRTYDEDRHPVREPKTASLLGALRSLAIFVLLRFKRHQPDPEDFTLPDLHRWTRNRLASAISWLTNPKPRTL